MRNYMSYNNLTSAPLPLLPPPPLITLIEATEITETTCSIEVTTTGTNGTIWVVIQLASTAAPTAEQIKAGLDGTGAPAIWAGSTTVDSIDSYDISKQPSGISAVSHKAYGVHEDSSGNSSPVAASAEFIGMLDILDLFDGTYTGFWYDLSDADLLRSAHTETPPVEVGTTGNNTACQIIVDRVGLDHMTLQEVADAATPVPVTSWINGGFDTFTTSGDDFTGTKSVSSGIDYAHGVTGLTIAVNKLYRLDAEITVQDAGSSQSMNLTAGTNSRATGVPLLSGGLGARHGYVVAENTQAGAHLSVARGNSGTIAVSSAFVRAIPGVPARQGGLTTQMPRRTAPASLKGNGTGIFMVTAQFASNTENSLVVRAKVPATLAGLQVPFGMMGNATGRLYIGFNASGNLVGGVGALTETVVKDAADHRGQTITVALTHDTANWFLYVDGIQVATGAVSGMPVTSQLLRLFVRNNNGANDSWYADEIYHFLAIKRKLTATQLLQIATQWSEE